MIICGITASIYTGAVKVLAFLCGLGFGAFVFSLAFRIYYDAHYSLPADSKSTVIAMAAVFFSSWLMFPILFILGSSGFFGHSNPPVSESMSIVGHSIADLLSKNL